MSTADVLQRLLSAEHATIYGYGALGAHLQGAEQASARQADEAHRARRDALRERLQSLSATPTPAAPGYELPGPVTDRASALGLAAQLEGGVAATYDGALADTREAELRRFAVAALQDAAVRATRWRYAADPRRPTTVALPGFTGG